MNLKATITSNDGTLSIAGAIDFLTVEPLWEQSLPLMAQKTKLEFDFSQVSSANSAALALLVEWLKYAKQEQKSVLFHRLPSKLISIATVAGIGYLLHEKEAAPA